MFTVGAILVGIVAAFVVGLSKTGLPGGALLAVPLLATVFDGRLIAGGTLPILLVADVFAVAWYHEHARWDVLRPLAPWIALGYVFGAGFFIAVGAATGAIAATIGVIVLTIVALQAVGAAAGNMIAIHNVVAASATVGLLGREGVTLRKTLLPTLYYLVVIGALGLLVIYVLGDPAPLVG